MQTVQLHTDGSCLENPGPGGWAAILVYGEHEKEMVGADPDTTNNRMELMAVIEGLAALKRPCAVTVYSDSRYVLDGIEKWLPGWKAKNWKTAAKKPVKNEDLWRRLDDARARHDVTWRWVKGHAGDPMNERADTLARDAATQARDGAA